MVPAVTQYYFLKIKKKNKMFRRVRESIPELYGLEASAIST